MARPKKMGLDYFPMDVDMLEEEEMLALLTRHGAQAVAVVLALLSRIYAREGYYMKYTPVAAELIAHRTHCDLAFVGAVVESCVELEMFDAQLFYDEAVLTAEDIQRKYMFAIKRRVKMRKISELCGEYWLLTEEETSEFGLEVSRCETSGVSDAETVQKSQKERKEKKSKEKQSIGEESREEAAGRSAAPPAKPAEENALSLDEDGFTMKKEEYDELCEEYGKSVVDAKWAHAIEWEAAQGKRYPVHMMRLKLRSWLEEDRQKARSGALSSGGSPGYSNKREGLPANYTGSRSGYYANQREYTEEELNEMFATRWEDLEV